ncbi:hypothetical protein ASZ90_010030 [hydrocarbon metagenome]|uniref:Uncharacterized protein n=1 Tax=hydrocarbon metagenome TaxID=938273 RepID=A0A0W8FH46_9ZZZZ
MTEAGELREGCMPSPQRLIPIIRRTFIIPETPDEATGNGITWGDMGRTKIRIRLAFLQ